MTTTRYPCLTAFENFRSVSHAGIDNRIDQTLGQLFHSRDSARLHRKHGPLLLGRVLQARHAKTRRRNSPRPQNISVCSPARSLSGRMLLALHVFPRSHARLNDPRCRIGRRARNGENHVPLQVQFWMGSAYFADRLFKLMLGFGGTGPRADSQVDIKITDGGNKRRLIRPARLDGVNRTLRTDESGRVSLAIFREPLLQQRNNLSGVDNWISSANNMPDSCIPEGPFNADSKPAKPDLF